MKITSIDVWTVVVPTIPGRVHSSEFAQETEWDQVPKCIIQLNTDTELCGIGETGRGVPPEDVLTGGSQLLGRNPESLMLQDVLGEPGGSGDHYPSIGQGAVYEAFEMAVFDLVGKARGVPVHALLGGAVRTRVRADYWIGHQTPEDGKRSVERALEAGFKGVKIKCTLEEPMVERLQAMLDVAGPEFKVTVDPNERFYTAPQAIELAHQLQALGNVEVFEDPIPKADLDGFVQIREQIDLPVAMHVGDGPSIIRAVKAEAVDCFNIGGSLVGFTRTAGVVAAAGMRCWHGSGNDLGIADTSYVHAAAATPNCTMASDFVGSWTRENDLIVEPILFEDGCVPIPMDPGLGCELDMEALTRYTREHRCLQV